MSDSGPGPDIVVAAMFTVAAILGVLASLPEGRLADAVGPVAAALSCSPSRARRRSPR